MDDIIEYVREWNLESSKNGLERYIEEKQQETAEEEKCGIAKNMLNKKMKIQDIMDVTGLTRKEILSLK